MELLKALSGALRPMGNAQGNRLVPLNDDGYTTRDHIFIICNAPKRRAKIQEMVAAGCTSDEQRRIHCVTVDEFLGSLSGLGAAHQAKQAPSTAGSEPKQATQGLDVSEAERQKATKKIWEDINRRKKKDRGEGE